MTIILMAITLIEVISNPVFRLRPYSKSRIAD